MLHKNQINSIANIILCVCLCFFFLEIFITSPLNFHIFEEGPEKEIEERRVQGKE